MEIYRDFDRFAERVAALLGGGATLHGLHARGVFDGDATTLEAHVVVATMRSP
jgi:hypothetical protein